MTLTENTLVADVAAAVPASVRVFQRFGVDFCCGGQKVPRLEELEAALHVHVHLENNILFPRGAALAGLEAETAGH